MHRSGVGGGFGSVRRAADENLPLTQSLSPAIPAARGMGEGTAESADRLKAVVWVAQQRKFLSSSYEKTKYDAVSTHIP